MLFSTITALTTLLGCATLGAAQKPLKSKLPVIRKAFDASIDLDSTATVSVPIPGGTKLGLPLKGTSKTWGPMLNSTFNGYVYQETYNVGTPNEYVDLQIYMQGNTTDGVPFFSSEFGIGKFGFNSTRNVRLDIGGRYEWMRSSYFIVQPVTPLPNLTVVVWLVTTPEY